MAFHLGGRLTGATKTRGLLTGGRLTGGDWPVASCAALKGE